MELNGDFLMSIDIEKLHKLMLKMQKICYEDSIEDGLFITIHEIFEVIILKLVEDNKISGAIQLTKKLLTL